MGRGKNRGPPPQGEQQMPESSWTPQSPITAWSPQQNGGWWDNQPQTWNQWQPPNPPMMNPMSLPLQPFPQFGFPLPFGQQQIPQQSALWGGAPSFFPSFPVPGPSWGAPVQAPLSQVGLSGYRTKRGYETSSDGPQSAGFFPTPAFPTATNGDQFVTASSSPPPRWERPSRPSRQSTPNEPEPIPVPEPTPAYLAQASRPPRALPSPQPMLVVIDLNGTLVYRPHRRQPHSFVGRPYVRAFLEYLLQRFTVVVWSSARPPNVAAMCRQLFTEAQLTQLAATWSRDCFGLTKAQYHNKVQVYKQLTVVWANERIQSKHPGCSDGAMVTSGGQPDGAKRWGQHNTILIDDSMLKASSEPHNLLEIPEFTGTRDQLHTDTLRQVAGYLEEARQQADVSAFIRENRFRVEGRWDWTWPAGSQRAFARREGGN